MLVRYALCAALPFLQLSCASAEQPAVSRADTIGVGEAQVALDSSTAVPGPPRSARAMRLSPLADSIARRMTFVAKNTTVLTAATRGGRWLVDVGRVDASLDTDQRMAAFREAAAARAPVRLGDTLHVYGSWGAARTTISGFSVWSGRITANVALPPAAESLAVIADQRAREPRGNDVPFAAAAYRYPLARDTSQSRTCADPGITSQLEPRISSVLDSLRGILLADTASAAPQYRTAPRAIASQLTGCFGSARVMLVVALRSGGDLLTRERAVLINDDESVTPLSVNDYRFRAHVMLHVLDADGDGIDDVAARGYGRRVGSLVILRLDLPARTLTRVTGGFSYEG
jgi:hypothetical protein